MQQLRTFSQPKSKAYVSFAVVVFIYLKEKHNFSLGHKMYSMLSVLMTATKALSFSFKECLK